jgi:hypothetical protein
MARRTRKTTAAPAAISEWALAGLDIEIAATRRHLELLLEQAAVLRRDRPSTVPPRAAVKRRPMSSAMRRRLSRLMKQRWAARKAGEKKR